jgi:hypothetical protein
MVWAAIGIGWRSRIVIFPQKSAKENKGFRLTAKSYVKRCLSPNIRALLARKAIFQQDGAKAHNNVEQACA